MPKILLLSVLFMQYMHVPVGVTYTATNGSDHEENMKWWVFRQMIWNVAVVVEWPDLCDTNNMSHESKTCTNSQWNCGGAASWNVVVKVPFLVPEPPNTASIEAVVCKDLVGPSISPMNPTIVVVSAEVTLYWNWMVMLTCSKKNYCYQMNYSL